MKVRSTLLILVCLTQARAETPLESAVTLYQAHRYPEVVPLLRKIIAAEPNNAAAYYYLGMTLQKRGDLDQLPDSVKLLEKAAALAPDNERFLADYGGSSLLLAARTRSPSAAFKGCDAMEKAIKLNPEDLDAREGLMQFYQQAPWPIGSSAKAQLQVDEIRKRDPDRATTLSVLIKTNTKDYAAAFQLCDDVLARKPDNYAALYQYGRTAAISGLNLQKGLSSLEKCLTLDPPGPAQPSHSNVLNRIGNLQEKMGKPAEARKSYESALKLDSGNRQASDALAAMR
jgi:tetratricopeptide (TPR) repeat protein